MFRPLAPLTRAELPDRVLSFWRMAGPGAILVGLSIGAGEIIIWPRITAQYGSTMVWAAVLGVFLQMWINFEIGRWTVATGETVYTGFSRVWRGFGPLFILFNVLGWLAPGWARASGLALKALLFEPHWHQVEVESGIWVAADLFGTDTFWTAVTFLIVAIALFGPKVAYKSVERTVEVLVLMITLGLIIVAVKVGKAEHWADLGSGLINVGGIAEGMDVKALFIAIVFAGAGGTSNLFYSFYLRDKHIGMGARIPEMHNPLRNRVEKMPATGYTFDDTPENASRFRKWWRYIVTDQLTFFFGLNTVTILLFIFGALAVLHANNIVPQDGTLIWDESFILKQQWGIFGQRLFLLVGVATLFSTQLTIVDGVSRSVADIVYTHFHGAQKRDVSWWYLIVAAAWMIVGVGLTCAFEFGFKLGTLDFLFNAAYMGGFAMAVYVPLTLWINLRHLPKTARPGPVCITMMSIATLVYTGFAIACIVWEVQQRLAAK